jgi:Ca2+-binding EF-hand superfamily protein
LSDVVQLREGAERLFDKHDVDGSGTLDIQEIVGVLNSLGKVQPKSS